jgi:protein tyrosine phosphatase
MNPNAPFLYSYWAEPGKILAGCCPGGYSSEMMHEHVTGIVASGITLVVNLMEISETDLLTKLFEPYEPILLDVAESQGRKIRVEHFPIQDSSIPTAQTMTSILQSIRKEVDAGGVVYVHCKGGTGRTGTVVGCYLVEKGHPNALELLSELTQGAKDYFWPTPQTEEQRAFVTKWKTSKS